VEAYAYVDYNLQSSTSHKDLQISTSTSHKETKGYSEVLHVGPCVK